MHKYLLLITASFLLVSCTSTAASNQPIDPNMNCEQISEEIEKMADVATKKRSTSEVNRTVDTGTTVAAQGASIAGVPYVGSVLSIGKTLLNHNKQSVAIKAQQAEKRLNNLYDLAYAKDCPY